MESLSKVSQRLMSLSPLAVSGPALPQAVLAAFDVSAVCLFDGASLECYCAGASRGDLPSKTRQGFSSGQAAAYPECGVVVQPLRVQGLLCGAIGFEGLGSPDATAPALAALATVELDRAMAFRAATTAAAHVEAETLRTAILDALAHEFKTPLATILTAAGGLRVDGSTTPEKAVLAELIENEAVRLGDLTTRLLRMARVDQEELKPCLQPANPAELAFRSVDQYSKLRPEAKISIRESGDISEVNVDPELIGLAISQLIENACRYSYTDSHVLIELESTKQMAAITIWNDGPPIAEKERERIFEQFYRGQQARETAAGSGLGLYIARKIARAHGGDLIFIGSRAGKIGFRLSVPFPADEETGGERKV
jgi:two-component system sensor histidine kinase KdpD